MGFADLSSSDAVLAAIDECHQKGEAEFLSDHGYRPSRFVRLFHNGHDYPAKALVGVAHGYQFAEEGPLPPSAFTSGDSTIAKLRQIGFEARRVEDSPTARLFVVRGGSDEEVVDYSLDSSVAATGWSELGDLSELDDAALDATMDATYADVGTGTLSQWKGAVRAFKEIRLDDWVLLPITSRGVFAVGKVIGAYSHRPENHELATNCYSVEWLETDVPRRLLGDLRSRVDRQPAVHRIRVDNAVPLIAEMLETREPISLGGGSRLQQVLESGLNAVAERDLDEIKKQIDADGPSALRDLLGDAHVVGSGTGQATPADVPWMSVYPRDATASAQVGFYGVYLFAADGSAVYLSFMQGTENVAGGLPPLRKRALDMRRAARVADVGDAISLASPVQRPRKYEAGSAYCVKYARGEVPHDESLLEDLQRVLAYVETARDAGLVLDPKREPTHLLFKWSRELEPETIEMHQALIRERGRTWWGKLGSPIGPSKLNALRGQLDAGVPTRAYLYGNKRLLRGTIASIATDSTEVPLSEVPAYLDAEECSLLVAITDLEELDPSWALENLVLSNEPDPSKVRGALGNRTTPLFVYERFVATDDGADEDLELSFDWLRAETLWSEEALEEILEALDPASGKGQVILAGPPGTGKTWVAERIARYLTQDQPLRRQLVQFHPSYGYEEFVEGIRPVASEHGIAFEPVKGIVLSLAEGMEDGDDLHVLIIDELNRANVPRVFGELLYLLEYRDQAIDLQYSSNFQLPSNLRIIATMNTADRSIRSIDVALRRRFDIFECPADAELLQRFYDSPQHSTAVAGLVEGFDKLNQDLRGLLDRHHTIGQSFFMAALYDRARLEKTWRRQILPLLEDYFFDQQDVVDEFTLDKYWPSS